MPITIAARKGVSAVAASAADERVVLTNHGRPVAVIDDAARLDADLARLREASAVVAEAAAEAVLDRRPARLDLDAVCRRLGLDAAMVRARALAACPPS
jgi:PHD/YefM family antitoxin component YafN of YafNO toxin-antitoxin module